jgi:hypothetical protein
MNPGTFQGAGTGVPVQTPRPQTYPQTIEYVTSSKTWTAPASGWVRFVACGGGGGGGAAAVNGNTADQKSCGGGAAGGFAIKTIYVTAGNKYVITIAAGGTGGSDSTTNSTTSGTGNTGGTTSVVGPSIYLLCNGGQGGQIKNVSGSSSVSVGGNAIGGDIVGIGGGGGAAATSYQPYATGGGGVGIYGGTGVSSQTSNSLGAGTLYTYFGNYYLSSPGNPYSANGVLNGTTISGAGQTSANTSNTVPQSSSVQHVPGIALDGVLGNAAVYTCNASGPGCGGSGVGTNFNTGEVQYGMKGGTFAGGSGVRGAGNTVIVGGAGGYGGGGGGGSTNANVYSVGDMYSVGGAGGQGLVVVEFIGA